MTAGVKSYPFDPMEAPELSIYCNPGTYLATNEQTRYMMGFLIPNTFSCPQCPAGFYCPGNDLQVACPAGKTSPAGSSSVSDCT